MAGVCSVCAHPQRSEIDKALIAGVVPVRAIACKFGVGRNPVTRHRNEHLTASLAEGAKAAQQAASAVIQQAEAQRQAHSIDVFADLTEQINRLRKLSDAIDQWLSDPDDPTRYTIDPRSDDLAVIYLDWRETNQNGEPKRKRANLRWLLTQIRDGTQKMLEPERVELKTADPRTLLGTVSDSLKNQMQLSILLLEKLYNAQAIESFEASVLDAIEEVAPDVRCTIERSLRSRRPLRQALGSPVGFA